MGVPSMVASMVDSHPVLVLAFFVQIMVCSFQHSAADIGAGAWVGEGITDLAAFVAEPIDARPAYR